METIGYKWIKGKVFNLFGKDACSWLQGQITQNVLNALFDHPIQFCFCNLNGYIEGIGLLLKTNECIKIVLDPNDVILFKKRLNHIILEDVQIEEANQIPILGFGKPPKRNFFTLEQPAWGDWITFDHLENIDWIDESTWHRVCLSKKMPLSGIDIKEKIFPVELGQDFEKLCVDYQKGCYIGQEILMRLHTQGKPRKKWMVFKTTVPLNGIINHPDQLNGLEVTSCIPNGSDYLCGIYVHRNIYTKSNNILIFSPENKVIGVKL